VAGAALERVTANTLEQVIPPEQVLTLEQVRALDEQDSLARHRAAFELPEGVIYLDGNSLGPLPRQTPARLAQAVAQDWGAGLIRSWTEAGWLEAPLRIGAKIGRIVGALPGEIVVSDSTSINLFKLMVAGARLRPGRGSIILEAGDFPTDRYMAEAAAKVLPGVRVIAVPTDALHAAIDADTALVVLCHVHYRSGRRHDMAMTNRTAHAVGALTLWDLSHSAGAVDVDLAGSDCDVAGGDGAIGNIGSSASGSCDLAVGCGYKFLNGGPGAPAFLFVSKRLADEIETPLPGWFGHRAPFDFAACYAGAAGAAGFQCGTAPILSLAAVESGVDNFLTADRAALFAKSALLFNVFAAQMAARCPSMILLTPREAGARGSHIAFSHPNAARIMRGLSARGVIGDFRPPDVMRFGITPLYLRFEDVWHAVETLAEVTGS
jgi:kynureninase